VGIALVLLLAWINGANNAGNVVGVAVGARSISAKRALQVAFIFEIIGSVLLGHYVSTTIMRGIIDPEKLGEDTLIKGVLVVALSANLWMLTATYLRVPLSVTQAVVGGILGFGLTALGPRGIMWTSLISTMFSWPLTLLLAVLVSMLLYRLYSSALSTIRKTTSLLVAFSTLLYACMVFTLLLVLGSIGDQVLLHTAVVLIPIPVVLGYALLVKRSTRGDYYEARYSVNKHLLLVSASLAALSHGAHDVGASAGLLQLLYNKLTESPEVEAYTGVSRVVLLVSGFTIAMGMLNWGYRVLGTLAERITPLTPESGFTAQFSAALTMLLVTRLGLPSSTTLAVTGAIIGVGLARGRGYINVKTVMRIFTTWIASFPATLLISSTMSALIFLT
jgi:PiT family inorganic phosphate transporter